MSRQTRTRDLSLTWLMMAARSLNAVPMMLDPALALRNADQHMVRARLIGERQVRLAMFSMTVMTLGTSSCARLIPSAIEAKLSSFVQAPTVDPGLDRQHRASRKDCKQTYCQLYSLIPSWLHRCRSSRKHS